MMLNFLLLECFYSENLFLSPHTFAAALSLKEVAIMNSLDLFSIQMLLTIGMDVACSLDLQKICIGLLISMVVEANLFVTLFRDQTLRDLVQRSL